METTKMNCDNIQKQADPLPADKTAEVPKTAKVEIKECKNEVCTINWKPHRRL
jgi:hypothetical protein